MSLNVAADDGSAELKFLRHERHVEPGLLHRQRGRDRSTPPRGRPTLWQMGRDYRLIRRRGRGRGSGRALPAWSAGCSRIEIEHGTIQIEKDKLNMLFVLILNYISRFFISANGSLRFGCCFVRIQSQRTRS